MARISCVLQENLSSFVVGLVVRVVALAAVGVCMCVSFT